jgi:hypothetical protein
MKAVLVVLVVAACGGRARQTAEPTAPARALTLAERMIAMLPEGAQLLVELDLARLRANPTVGEVATRALAELGADAKLPGLPVTVQGSPLANADFVVLAAYGVGTPSAATVTVLATKDEVAGAARLADDLVALGPADWLAQVEARAGIAKHSPLAPSLALMSLRDHAMPAKAPGAVVRVTAQLPLDARISLAQQLGLSTAPARLAIWGDVVDDLAIIVDADATDPGDPKGKDAAKRLQAALARLLEAATREPALQVLGLTRAVRDARIIRERAWLRIIITVGPRQLGRAVERARAMLAPAS